jgi:hypothetical protein
MATSEAQLDQANQVLRANPEYQQFLQSLGVNTNVAAGQAWRLSDQQRKQAASWVESRLGDIGKGMEIDISGNINQNEGFGKQAKRWGPIVAGAALAAFGIPGVMPGLLGGSGSAAAGGASAAGAASGGGGLTAGLMSAVPANIASQGVSAGLGVASGVGSAAAAGGGGWLSSLLGGRVPDLIGAAGAGLDAISQGQGKARGDKFGAQMDLERLLMDRERNDQNMRISREQEGRASGTDAWRRLLAAQRTLTPGPRPQLSPYSVASRQATGAEREGADAMTREVMARMTGGNPIPQVTERPMDVDRGLMDAGWLERLTGITGAGLGAYSRLRPQSPSYATR